MIGAHFRVVAEHLSFPEGPVALPDGSVLLVEIASGDLSRVSPDGEVIRVAHLGGSPNGAAIGPDGKCYVCNSGGFRWHDRPGFGLFGGMQSDGYDGGRIQRVDLSTGSVELLYENSDAGPLKGPNDLVFDAHGGFWLTDSGKTRDDDRDHGSILYGRADGTLLRRVIHPIIHPHPNGIGLSPDGQLLYMAETATGRIWRFKIAGPGEVERAPFPSPHGGTLVAGLSGYQLLDSLAVEANGNICVATMMNGGISVVSPDGASVEHIALPDLLTTNICFGGAGLRKAYVTLSATGKLIEIDWPRAGLPLNFLNIDPTQPS
jgi:gluconolactonase